MPLSFETQSHCEIAFGFFNIDTDMLLMNNYFVFATDFCDWIIDWTKQTSDMTSALDLYMIDETEKIGNLMGAISGVVFTGFIGEVYKKYPFPKKPEDFRQKPEGDKNRSVVENIVKEFGTIRPIKILTNEKEQTITIGDFVFSAEQFHEVIYYVWRGGMPKWTDDKMPGYVENMMKAVLTSKYWLFKVKHND
jgi:hypothetical protein